MKLNQKFLLPKKRVGAYLRRWLGWAGIVVIYVMWTGTYDVKVYGEGLDSLSKMEILDFNYCTCEGKCDKETREMLDNHRAVDCTLLKRIFCSRMNISETDCIDKSIKEIFIQYLPKHKNFVGGKNKK